MGKLIKIVNGEKKLDVTERVFNIVYKNNGYEKLREEPQKKKEVKEDEKPRKTKKAD